MSTMVTNRTKKKKKLRRILNKKLRGLQLAQQQSKPLHATTTEGLYIREGLFIFWTITKDATMKDPMMVMSLDLTLKKWELHVGQDQRG